MHLAKAHTAKQGAYWTVTILFLAIGFLLCSGLALHWQNPAHRQIVPNFGTTPSPTPTPSTSR